MRGLVKVLTLYFTKDESTLNIESLKSVLAQEGVSQDIYVVSTHFLNLDKYGLYLPNIVVPTKSSWPVPVRIGYSFNSAILQIRNEIEKTNYHFIFKVDGDVILPKNYLINLISRKPLIAGIGPALVISTKFFRKLLKGKYPINYCDDGYILALAISKGIWSLRYEGKGDLKIHPIITLKDREYIYGMEFYKWGLPLILLLILPLSRIYLKITRKIKPYQQREIWVYLYNIVGYLYAFVHRIKRYEFHHEYGKMRIRHLYDSLLH